MEAPPQSAPEKNDSRTRQLLGGLAAAFLGLAALFVANLWGRPEPRAKIPNVDPSFLETTPWRRTFADLKAAKEDLSDYDCYACHEKNKPPPIRFDAQQKIIIPKEHANIAMGHGSHDRNNLCYNCHTEQDLLTLQVRDGRVVKFDDIPPLCGSCHGPTYRDWEAGAHGRTSGFWLRSLGAASRLSCASCHDPHSPRIPTRPPAPGPHPLHGPVASAHPEPAR